MKQTPVPSSEELRLIRWNCNSTCCWQLIVEVSFFCYHVCCEKYSSPLILILYDNLINAQSVASNSIHRLDLQRTLHSAMERLCLLRETHLCALGCTEHVLHFHGLHDADLLASFDLFDMGTVRKTVEASGSQVCTYVLTRLNIDGDEFSGHRRNQDFRVVNLWLGQHVVGILMSNRSADNLKE